jgi:hypothetical protein
MEASVRPRFTLLAVFAAAIALTSALPTQALAKHHRHGPPVHNRGLTIAAAPNPISTGDPVLVYGRLDGPDNGGQQITLWHNIADVPGGFTPVTHATTDTNGFWSIPRADGVVTTNRAWFATAGQGVHSRTILERVHATVTLDQPADPLVTRQPVTLTGTVAPNHAGDRVILQRQDGANGDRWRTIDATHLDSGSHYTIVHRFLRPGDRTLRVVFRGDRRNFRGESTPISITVQQEQIDGFTIASSIPSADFGQTVTLSGTFSGAAAGTSVTLFARGELTPPRRFSAMATSTTDASGNYAFPQAPARNTVYQVRVTSDPRHRTAPLFQGVHSVVAIAASASTASVGDQVTFTGTVQPSKVGHVIVLQRLGDDGIWRDVEVGRVGDSSTYSLGHVLEIAAPAQQFRTLVPGGPANQRGISSAVTIAVNPSTASALPGSGLPAAS